MKRYASNAPMQADPAGEWVRATDVADLINAARSAARLLDMVAFVAQEGDTEKPLADLRAALAKATSVR